MAQTQIMGPPQIPLKYSQKKFQQTSYTHKKFGTYIAQQPEKTQQFPAKITERIEHQNKSTKRSAGDIFRPYAFDNPRKRKYHEIQDVEEQNQPSSSSSLTMEFKTFAPSPIISADYTIPPHFIAPIYPFTIPSLHSYQFNPQIFTVLLQKQQGAIYMGEMIKANLNLYNHMGNY